MNRSAVLVAAAAVFAGVSGAGAQEDTLVISLEAGTYVCETEADANRAAEAQRQNISPSGLQPPAICGQLSKDSRARIVQSSSASVIAVSLEEDPGTIWYVPKREMKSGLIIGLPDRETALTERRLKGRAIGEQAGKKVGTGLWFGVGFLGGLWMPVVGAGIAVGVAASEDAQPVFVPSEALAPYATMGPIFEEEFRKGFRDAVLTKRKTSALVGGLTSTALWVALIVAAVSATS